MPQYGERDAEPPVLSMALDDRKATAAASTLERRVNLGIRRTLIGTKVAPYTCATALADLGLEYIDGISRSVQADEVKRVAQEIDRWPYDSETTNRVRLLRGY